MSGSGLDCQLIDCDFRPRDSLVKLLVGGFDRQILRQELPVVSAGFFVEPSDRVSEISQSFRQRSAVRILDRIRSRQQQRKELVTVARRIELKNELRWICLCAFLVGRLIPGSAPGISTAAA